REIASPQLNELGDKVHIDVQDSPRASALLRGNENGKRSWTRSLRGKE
uniref:Uncharacterized protein n=1 Tax=Aegilops tauschii subsp. strangulata TaxID=200361 RepID=A0A453KRS1_AEGTS